jgi:hypothetical protein
VSRHVSVAFLVTAAVLGAGAAGAQLPVEPGRDSGMSVTGAFEGFFQNPDGTSTILVGYLNRNRVQTLDIPIGPNNRIEPGGPDYGQPTHFLPRRNWGVFTITVPASFAAQKQKLTWTLVANGQTTSVPLHLDPLWVVEPYEEQGMGNSPPIVRFDRAGPAFQGPPRGIAATYTADTATALTLTVWASDPPPKRVDEAAEAAAARRAAQGQPRPLVTMLWSKFRGPGDVTFQNVRPEVDLKAEGRATTTARFSAPGEYILRAQVNDTSGDGGGGNQCCWTNAHVKVTVR